MKEHKTDLLTQNTFLNSKPTLKEEEKEEEKKKKRRYWRNIMNRFPGIAPFCFLPSRFTFHFILPNTLQTEIDAWHKLWVIHLLVIWCISPCLVWPVELSLWAHLLVVGMLGFMSKTATELAHLKKKKTCSCVCFCLHGPFNCIWFHKFSRQLSAFSLSFSVLPVLFLPY